ncbi:hypothetical protein GCM10023350_16020 [Nocardioides endophyticus]|uniref:PAS domain-containing protein n=1 Tax=Nocardioides endophyticus TaxID=1353775 RepID=A0ABP8YM97_9ACTN
MAPQVAGVEWVLGADDVIVTKTDLTYANEVFCQVSAMSEVDLLGKPHNVIRHPPTCLVPCSACCGTPSRTVMRSSRTSPLEWPHVRPLRVE